MLTISHVRGKETQMKKVILVAGMTVGLLFSGIVVWDANATTISILDSGDTGMTADGTIFLGDPNPTEPSTGTGVFEPFVRIQEPTGGDGLQNGFNTDAKEPDINFETKDGSDWTRSVMFSELGVVTLGGMSYYELQLDANQLGKANSSKNQITITQMEIFSPGAMNISI